MVEAALNVTAEQVIEWDASGTLLVAKEQGAKERPRACIRVPATTSGWRWRSSRTSSGATSLRRWASPTTPGGGPRTAAGPAPAPSTAAWPPGARNAPRKKQPTFSRTPVSRPPRLSAAVTSPSIRSCAIGRLFELEDHPVTGRHEIPTLPFRFTGVAAWMSSPSPTLGQHNDEVLGEMASPSELAELRRAGVIGDRLHG